MAYVLKDLIAISKDGEWGKGEPFDESVEMIVVRGTDFGDVRFGDTLTTPRRHIPKHIAERKKLQPWDVIIEVAGGTKNQITGRTVLLRPHLFSCSELPLTCASFSRFIRFNTELCDPEFMFWYLQHLYAAGAMHAYHTQHTGVARFQWTTFSEREPLKIPVLAAQRRIAGILSAYDELIENSQRRIGILEAMARALYREWFVHFRFPGHENCPRVASPLGEIPKEWEVKSVESFCTLVTRGVTPKYETGSGRFIINQKVNRGTELSLGDLKELEIALEVPPEKFARFGDVLVNCLGEGTIGRVHFYSETHRDWAVDQHMSICRAAKTSSALYIYFTLESEEGQGRIASLKTGGTNMTMFNISALRSFALVSPPENLLARFADLALPMLRQKQALTELNRNLRRARDLLLPRLLSGQIDVEAA